MPRHYMYRCNKCGHTERRYRNSTKCRKCGDDIVRVTTKPSQPTTECSQPPRLMPARELVIRLRFRIDDLERALREILDEAEGDFDRDVIITAARGALREEE